MVVVGALRPGSAGGGAATPWLALALLAVLLAPVAGCPGDDDDFSTDDDGDDDDGDDDTSDDDSAGDDDGGDDDGADDDSAAGDADGDGFTVEDGDCDDGDANVHPGADELCDGLDNDCDQEVDEELLGSGEACPAASCQAILDGAAATGDGVYWLAPPGDPASAWEAFCDMTGDGGGWTRLFSSHFPTMWGADWEQAGDPTDDDYSALDHRQDLAVKGVYTFRLEVGDAGTWNTAPRAHHTIWTQAHDPFTATTDGGDFVLVAGELSTTCDGFNGLHHRHHDEGDPQGTRFARAADVDAGDWLGCWWMQVVPLEPYLDFYYLDGYGGLFHEHLWQTLWVR